MQKVSLGQLNFEAYTRSKGGKTYDGKQIPTWENLSLEVRRAWEAGAREVKQAVELEQANAFAQGKQKP